MIDLTHKTVEALFEDLPEFITKQQLLDKLGFSSAGPVASLALQRWMTRQGWHSHRRQVDGMRVWGYARTLASQSAEPSDVPTGSAVEQLHALVEAVRVFRNEPSLERLGGLRGTRGYTGLCLAWEDARDWLDAPPAPSRAIGEVVISTSLTGHDGLQMIKWADDAPPITVGMKVYAETGNAEPDLADLNEDLIAILGRPNFTCIRLAQALRLCGADIKTKAEHEQAAVIHFLLMRYVRHGKDWAKVADEDLRAMLDEAKAKNKAAMS